MPHPALSLTSCHLPPDLEQLGFALSLLVVPILHQIPVAKPMDALQVQFSCCRIPAFPRWLLSKQPGSVQGWSSHTCQKHPFLISEISQWRKTFVLFLGVPPSLLP